MMRHIRILIFLFLPFQSALAEDLSGKLMYFCDAKKSEVSINLDEQSSSLTKPGFIKKVVNWSNLLQLGPQKNGRGDPLKSGSKVAVRQCGMIQIRMESGFINDNIQGESGAFDFPVIELRIGERTVLSRTALESCSENDRRANIYFGACADNWAQSIRTKMLANGSLETEIKRKFDDKNDQPKEAIENHVIFE